MPLFDFKCDGCGFQFEVIQSISTTDNQRCPECGGRTKRMVSKCSFQLAGSGWAKDNYGGEKK